MSTKRNILDAFRGEMRTSVVEFGKRLWEMDSDVFIFMARKAACFFDCLREQKLADVRGIAVSDRVLDMDLAFLKGKRVTLVDDCVFSGTTLFHAKTAVHKAEAASCDTITLSVNSDWIRPQLLPGGAEASLLNFVEPIIQLDDAQCVQQCYDIVRAISIFPRPYDVDFPHTQTTKMAGTNLQRLLTTAGWQPYDVSSDFQLENGVRVYTMLPNSGTQRSFFERHLGLDPITQATKIRIYAKELSEDVWSVRLVPIVVLGAVDRSQLSTEASWGPSLHSQLCSAGLHSPKSRYRLLQFLASIDLLHDFVGHASLSLSAPIETALRSDLAEMAFGHRYNDFIDSAFASFGHINLPAAVPEPPSQTTAGFSRTPTSASSATELVAECVRPFTWLYRNLELPARKAVLESGLQQSLDESRADLIRLGRGFSLRALTDRLKSTELDVNRFASVFLDKAIDLGIAVPTIVEDQGTIYRAFRHGEDAVFGEAEERLTSIALQAFMDARGIGSVYELELQKFIVLFAQIAMREGHLLERLHASESVNLGCQVLSVKGHLHGPVPTLVKPDASGSVGAPFVDGNTHPAPWLVRNWVERGILQIDQGGLSPIGPGDVQDAAKLVQRCARGTDQVAQLIQENLRESTKAVLAGWSEGDKPNELQLRSILDDLNAMCERESVLSDERLRAQASSSLAARWLANPPRSLKKRIQLCRVLLEDALATEVNRRGRGTKYVVGEIPDLAIGPRKEAKARKIGRLLGRVVGKHHALGQRPLNNDTDLVLLSTCTEADHQVRALSGELAILLERLPKALADVRRLAKAGDLEGANRSLKQNFVYIAANSGAMKYRWFSDQELPALLQKVARHCRDIDKSGDLEDDWWQFWPESAMPALSGVSPAVLQHIDSLGHWILATNVALRMFGLWLLQSSRKSDAGPDVSVKHAQTDLLDWCRHYVDYCKESGNSDFRNVVDEIRSSGPYLDKSLMDRLSRQAADILGTSGRNEFRRLLDDSRLLCENFGIAGEFRPFPYALYFDVGLPKFGGAFDVQQRQALADLASDGFRLLDDSRNPWRSGTWMLLRGNRNSTAAAELCARLVRICLRSSMQFRAVLIGQLAYDDSVRDMHGSIKLAEGDFLRRISDLRSKVLSPELDNSITCLTDSSSAGSPESQKMTVALESLSHKVESSVVVSSGGADLQTRKYSKAVIQVHRLVMSEQQTSIGAVSMSLGTQSELAAKYRGSIDVGIITIREDEFEAVLDRFPNRVLTKGSGSDYLIAELQSHDGQQCRVAIARSPEQGTGAAQGTASSMIHDLEPRWILVVGIAGGLPATEYSLGDVLLSQRMNDFAVTAVVDGEAPTYQDMGGPIALEAQKLIATLKGIKDQLGDWNSPNSVGKVRPTVVPPTLESKELYGDDKWKQSVIDSLNRNFPVGQPSRRPYFHAAVMITGNTLLKSVTLARQWKQTARSTAAIEMELGGVARAAHLAGLGTRVLAVRGLSDIVGYARSPDWTDFACHSAAAFAHALVRTGHLRAPR